MLLIIFYYYYLLLLEFIKFTPIQDGWKLISLSVLITSN